MSRLVRLYPEAWRSRYEAEFLALLEERPPTIGDVLDTVRGAVDAHLHPHLAGGEIEPPRWTHRIPGLLAFTAGVMWSASVLSFMIPGDPSWQLWGLLPLSMLFMFLGLPGDYMAAHGRRIAIAIGLIGICIVGANLQLWPLQVVAASAGYLIALGGMLTLAAVRAGVGSSGRWMLLVLSVGLPVTISLPAAVGLVSIDSDAMWYLAVVLPYGAAWIVIGLRMAIRGSATFIEQSTSPVESEVRPA